MADISTEKTLTANHVNVYASGEGRRILIGQSSSARLGDITSSDVSFSTGARPIGVVGSEEPQEIVDGLHSYTVRIGKLRLRSDKAPNPGELLRAGPIDIEGYDRFTKKLIFSVTGCHLSDGGLSVQANSVVQKNLSFQGLSARL